MNVHIFGAVSSPSVANFALRSVADEPHPACVSSTISYNFYVDDCLKSVDTDHEAIQLIDDLTMACKEKGFRLTKFVSNSHEVMAHIPPQERSKETKNCSLEDKLPVEKALGLRWNVEEDVFEFAIKNVHSESTRRGILSSVSSVYDPLGFIAPVILPAKSILQGLCKDNHKEWDAVVPEKMLKEWLDWKEQLPLLSQLKIPRCFIPLHFDVVQKELHVFSDASTYGYGAVVYLRMLDAHGQYAVSFVMGKSRLAPIKETSVPRLELSAALTAVKLGHMAKLELSDEFPVQYYTDSTTVLHYISNDKQRWPVFVANRVSKIRDYSEPCQWHYVPSAHNPADEASRGLSIDDLFHSAWLKGPEFLGKSRTEWPTTNGPVAVDTDIGLSPVASLAVGIKEEPATPCERLMQHSSSWCKLRTFVAVFLKVKTILKERVMHRDGRNLSVSASYALVLSDLESAEVAILKWQQMTSFQREYDGLVQGHRIPKSSRLSSLDPFLEDDVLRVGGRLRHSNVPYDMKHPIILPKGSHITTLIIRREHALLGHVGRHHVLSSLRKKFWIISGNSAVRQVIKDCVACRRMSKECEWQKMADLPECRTDDMHPPFHHTGVDYFGPFLVKEGRKEVKRYGVVFSCMSSRAIHLEVATSLDTDSCVHALRRFIARRGFVRYIYSDNGTNFVGACREMQRVWKMDLEWRFNPPSASHFGGAWERMIRTVRKVLSGLLSEHSIRLDSESLHTFLCEVEAIINSRPITAVSSDATDPEPLTPNHILTGKTYVALCHPDAFQEADVYLRRRWRKVQQLASSFWTRWRKEFLTLLQSRQKWLKSGPREHPEGRHHHPQGGQRRQE